MLPWVCTIIDHRRCRNVVRTPVTHQAHCSYQAVKGFDVFCDLLLNMETFS